MFLEYYKLDQKEILEGHGHSRLHISIVQKGGFTELINGIERDCNSNTIRLSPAHTMHKLTAHEEGAIGAIVELPDHKIRSLSTPLESSTFLAHDRVKVLSSKILFAWEENDKFAAEGAALELLARTVFSTRDVEPPEWLDEFKQDLLCNSSNSYSLSKLSSRFNRHRSHVSRSFRKWYGRTPGEHLRSYRLSLAQLNLRESDQPIVQIALELGFVDQAHFSREFLKQFNQTPGNYRKSGSAQS